MPILVGWFNTNLSGHLRRSTGSAWQVGFGNIGGIIASYTFPTRDKPRYTKGYAICLGFVCLSLISSTLYFAAVTAQNKQRDRRVARGEEDEGEEREKDMLGDLSVHYRYLR
jgi:hypothetical protein